MEKADLAKAGGILALVAGIAQTFGYLFSIDLLPDWARFFEGPRGGRDYPSPFPIVLGMMIGCAIQVFGALLISGARGKIPGIALIVCAFLNVVCGPVFAVLAVPVLTAGVVALIGGFGARGQALRGLMATAQRMAEAAKETGTADTKDAKETDETDEKKS